MPSHQKLKLPSFKTIKAYSSLRQIYMYQPRCSDCARRHGQSILLQVAANSWQGIKTSDDGRFTHLFWEFPQEIKGWYFYQRVSYNVVLFAGRHDMIFWGRWLWPANRGLSKRSELSR